MPYIRPDEVRTWMLKDMEAQTPGKTVAEMIAAMNADLPHDCPKCTAVGRYNIGTEDAPIMVPCEVCRGMGKTKEEVAVITQPPIYQNSQDEPDAPDQEPAGEVDGGDPPGEE